MGAQTPKEQPDIDVMQGLNAKVINRVASEAPVAGGPVVGGTIPGKREATGTVSLRWLSVSLTWVQRIVDCEEEPGTHGNSFAEDLLAIEPVIVMESGQGHLL